MHNIEPFYNWRGLYIASEDEQSPFFGREYSEFEFTHHLYDHAIHPQWDEFGSSTLFLKIIYADYEMGFAVIEMIGEWNDCLHNDIMFLKRDLLEELMYSGIHKFILIGENVLNFHSSDDCYYQEWHEEIQECGGWIALLNFRAHVMEEFQRANITDYFVQGGEWFDAVNWRTNHPNQLFQRIEEIQKGLDAFSPILLNA